MGFQKVIAPLVYKRFVSKSSSPPKLRTSRLLLGTLITTVSGSLLWSYQTQLKDFWEDNLSDSKELSPEDFTKYRITNKVDVDDSHYFMELTPLKKQNMNLWETFGNIKLWSVEVKQPEIMVVRNYTPLPLQFDSSGKHIERFTKESGSCGGKLTFYIKSYKNGEVARWLHRLPVGEIVELRGPTIDYSLPEENKQNMPPHFDIAAFTGGTGIVTALQLGLNPYSKIDRKIDLYHSCNNRDELGELLPFIKQLDLENKLKFHLFESSKGESITAAESSIPGPINSRNPIDKSTINCGLALVCGPDGYITDVAGFKYDLQQGPVGGLLKRKGWDNHNVYKLG